MILIAAFTAIVAVMVFAAVRVQRTHARCARCHHRSTIRLTPSLLFPTLYCVRCRFEWVPTYDMRFPGFLGGDRTAGTKS